MNEVPETVLPGQIWIDNDLRTKGAGEMRVLGTWSGSDEDDWLLDEEMSEETSQRVQKLLRLSTPRKGGMAVVDRGHRLSVVSTQRMLTKTNTKRGYTYIGMGR